MAPRNSYRYTGSSYSTFAPLFVLVFLFRVLLVFVFQLDFSFVLDIEKLNVPSLARSIAPQGGTDVGRQDIQELPYGGQGCPKKLHGEQPNPSRPSSRPPPPLRLWMDAWSMIK